MSVAINNVSLEINNEKIAYKQDTVAVKLGIPGTNVYTDSLGGGAVELVHEIDITESEGVIKFSRRVTKNSKAFLRGLQENFANNKVLLTDPITGATFSLKNASLTNGSDIELTLQTDGDYEVELKGDRIV